MPMRALETLPLPTAPPPCICKIEYHNPPIGPWGRTGTWTVLPDCAVHWNPLPARRRLEILALRLQRPVTDPREVGLRA